jgi:hypothetical protein
MVAPRTIKQIARWQRKKPQTIRNSIDIALHRLALLSP